MARTNAKKREGQLAAARKRQADRRARMRATGKPDTNTVDKAVMEALAYTMASTQTTSVNVTATTISVSTLVWTAITILVDREGFDRAQSKAALKLRLRQREEHLDPSYVPSLVPDPVLQMQRMHQASNARLFADIASETERA